MSQLTTVQDEIERRAQNKVNLYLEDIRCVLAHVTVAEFQTALNKWVENARTTEWNMADVYRQSFGTDLREIAAEKLLPKYIQRETEDFFAQIEQAVQKQKEDDLPY